MGVPERLLAAVMMQESSGDPHAVSSSGAQGLFQIMPGTAKGLGVTDPFDPMQSALGGAIFLRNLYKRFGSWELALAAYNAGEGAVEQAGGIPAETQHYVASIMAMLGGRP